jgi:hypothetical protein
MPGVRASLIKPYLKLVSDESLELLAEATVWDDVRCPAGSAGPAATNPPFVKFLDNGAGSVGVFAFEFADPGVEDDLLWDVQYPHGLKVGTALVPSIVYPHIHWSPSTAAAGNVGWGIELTEANIGETFPLTTLPAPVADATAGIAFHHQLTSFAPVTKVDRYISCMMKARTYRTDAGGIDTYAATIFVHEFDVHIEIDTIASKERFVK